MNSLALLGTILLTASSLSNPLDGETRASCTLEGESISDLSSIKQSCTSITIRDLNVPAGQTLDLTGLKSGTTVTFSGTINFGVKEWDGPLIAVSGSQITVNGASGNRINGGGPSYWDGQGGNGGIDKPRFFRAARLDHSVIRNINIYDSPVHVFSINRCQNLTVDNVLIDDSKGDSGGGHNTDGFDVGRSSQITIKNTRVYNQDDCLAVNSGTDILFENNYCSGGHGISIGSVGGRDDNVVRNVVVRNCEVANSDNGIRIKTVYGATGSVSDITFQDITLTNITRYGITVRGDYTNSGSRGNATDGVPIRNLVVRNVRGTIRSGGTRVMVLVKGASEWRWSGVSLSGGRSTNDCSGIPSGSGAQC
ncbi:polygalacturonase-like [Agrilus planipennis]|uniref:endo-polygalacturonase n=1 Tax=Agrilus planipennis TaxID=224129 RepID=A0A1W4WVJ2_AGRPL|nr:polygalacturonase-like [Agrilus planipennis]